MAASAPGILVERDPETHIARITIHNPERKNAFRAEFGLEMERHLDELAQDDDIKVIILRAAAERSPAASIFRRPTTGTPRTARSAGRASAAGCQSTAAASACSTSSSGVPRSPSARSRSTRSASASSSR